MEEPTGLHNEFSTTYTYVTLNSTYNDYNLLCSGDLLRHIQYYALESICAITLDVRMGCLKDKPNDDRVIEVMNAIETVLADMAKCMLGPPLFKIHPRLSPPFMRMGAGLDVFADFVRDKVDG